MFFYLLLLLFQLWISRVSHPAVKAWSESQLSGYLRLHTSASGCKKRVNGGLINSCGSASFWKQSSSHALLLIPSRLLYIAWAFVCIACKEWKLISHSEYIYVETHDVFSPCCLLFSQTEEVYGQTVRVQCWC